ncbi:MAG: coenzyme F420-0:L-glutamate ligase [Cryobacterium sp.]|nr:coenzyme F420-0:L-glutamate ligase [Cryobacterium sp.]
MGADRRGGADERDGRVAERRDEVSQGRYPQPFRARADGEARSSGGLRGPHGHLQRPRRAPRLDSEVRRPRLRPHLPAQCRPQSARVDRRVRARRAPEDRALTMFSVIPLTGMAEVAEGDDLVDLIADAAVANGVELADGDILVVTSKIVSKAEGRLVTALDREDAITAETVRVVATKEHTGGTTRIVQNRQGLVLAAAGVDSSNAPHGTVLLLPEDPDASARALCAGLRARGPRVGVVLSDTLGRPWRLGQTDVAIGAAGVRALDDLRGGTDAHGRTLEATIVAVADELAGAAELVKGKASGVPVAIVRGLGHLVGELDEPGASSIIRPLADDLFSLGTEEAYAAGYRDAAAGLPAAPASAASAATGGSASA